jgi:hypothetical protein
MDGFYKANRDFESKYALDLGIVSPFVPFLRGESGALLERFSLCTVISVPAPVKGCIAKKDRDDLIPWPDSPNRNGSPARGLPPYRRPGSRRVGLRRPREFPGRRGPRVFARPS